METKPFVFWSILLKDPSIAWQTNTKKLINTILVLPVGSAEAERGFSIMNYIKSKRRARLLPETLDHIMRIRINGPEVKKFAARKYAKAWVNEKHMRTDDPLNIRPRVSTEQFVFLTLPQY